MNQNITDRNRTSPFAFIGNRFEFRMPGAFASVAVCNTVINTIMAESLSNIADKLENSECFYDDLKKVLSKLLIEHKKIVYNGNSYSSEWEKEASRRNLKNIKTSPEAFKSFISEDSIKLFEAYSVYTENELISRYNIKLEKYIRTILLEANVMKRIIDKEILPSCLKYLDFLSNLINNKTQLEYASIEVEKDIFESIDYKIKSLYNLTKTLEKNIEECNAIDKIIKKTEFCEDIIILNMNSVREYADDLEKNIPKEYWTMPTYQDILL